MLRNLLGAMAFGLATQAVANQNVGNGGEAVVCPGEPGSVELYDFFEARTRGLHIDLGDAVLPVADKIAMAIGHLPDLDPDRKALLTKWAHDFFDPQSPDGAATFPRDIDLHDIPDADPRGVPEGCRIKQIAAQQTPLFDGD